MGKAARMTEAKIRRAIRAARADDPRSIVEVHGDVIRILPPDTQIATVAAEDEVDTWFGKHDQS